MTTPDLLLDRIEEAYGLRVYSTHKVDRGLRGIWRLETSKGSLACKWYDPSLASFATVERSLWGSSIAAECGVPTPAIIMDKDGDPYIETDCGWYIIYSYISGKTLAEGQFSSKTAFILGSVIGQMQKVFKANPSTSIHPDLPWPLDISWGAQYLGDLVDCAKQGAFGRYSETSYKAFQAHHEHYLSLVDSFAGIQQLPQQWVHGDCNPGNFHFSEDDCLTGVFDFDNVSFLARGFDFMYALNQSFREDHALIRSALLGYLEAVAVTKEELVLYGPMWLFYSFLNLWPHNETGVTCDDWDNTFSWQELIDNLHWWQANMDSMMQLFSDVYDEWKRMST